MKFYKGFFLAILIVVSVPLALIPMALLPGDEKVVLLVMVLGGLLYNWNYAAGNYPQTTFSGAVLTNVLLSIGAMLLTTVFSPAAFGQLSALLKKGVPGVFFALVTLAALIVISLISASLKVVVWRWLFKEVREARSQEIALIN